MEKSNSVDRFLTLSDSIPVFLISAIATGNIIAPTVCSPINEDRIAEIDTKPKTMLDVLLPVIVITPRANLLSKP